MSPEWDDLAFAAVIAGLALTGLEAASGVAGEIRPNRKQMSRVIGVSSATAFLVLIGVSLVGLMALPVVGGLTPLGEQFHEAPLLGVVSTLRLVRRTPCATSSARLPPWCSSRRPRRT